MQQELLNHILDNSNKINYDKCKYTNATDYFNYLFLTKAYNSNDNENKNLVLECHNFLESLDFFEDDKYSIKIGL